MDTDGLRFFGENFEGEKNHDHLFAPLRLCASQFLVHWPGKINSFFGMEPRLRGSSIP